MSVVVDRKPVKQPPPERIAAGTKNLDWNGNLVVFSNVDPTHLDDGPALSVSTSQPGDWGLKGCLAHLDPSDARDLAAALVEWADAVEGA
jgi:hypothetical protein